MNLEVLSIIGFFAAIIVLAYYDRKNMEFKKGVIYRRTKKGKKFIKKMARNHKRFFKIFGIISVVIAFIVSIGGMVILLKMTHIMILEPNVGPTAKLILPEVPIKGLCTHFLCVPFWFWIITIFAIIAPHELMHGFLMAAEKIKIRSLGLILFLIFPGAFVEPDEKQFQKAKPKVRMKVAAVGSIANIIVFILISIIASVYAPYADQGVDFFSYVNNTPAQNVELQGTITEINENPINNIEDLENTLSSAKPGQEIYVITTKGEYVFNTTTHPENETMAFMGISQIKTNFSRFYRLLYWMSLLSLNVAIINLLPFLPFDGGIMWHALFEKYFKKNAKFMILGLSFFVYGIIILNVIGVQRIIGLFLG